jgi:hypothetical protein
MAAMRGVDGAQNGLGGGVKQGYQQSGSGYLNVADSLGLLECRVRAGSLDVSQHPFLRLWVSVEEWRGSRVGRVVDWQACARVLDIDNAHGKAAAVWS